jgi:small redox-active disulfide protein 2
MFTGRSAHTLDGKWREPIMDSSDFRKIRVGDNDVGIIGLHAAMEAIAESHADEPDESVREELISRLSKSNYISGSSRDSYGKAFVREFRKFLGRPCQDEPQDNSLRVQVFGPGCFQCDQLEQSVIRLLSELGLPASFEHITDMEEIVRHGIMRPPALVINGKVVSMGSVPSPRKIKDWLTELTKERG